jgi:hypothetical protein
MHAVTVVIVLELIQFPLQIGFRPKQDLIEILAPDRSDQPFDEGVENGHVGYRFNSSIPAIKQVMVLYNGREVELMVTSSEYAAAKQTGYYSQKMKLGGFGYYYNWKLVYWR